MRPSCSSPTRQLAAVCLFIKNKLTDVADFMSCFEAWLFELAGGAITEFEDTCVPKVQREATFTIAALHQWDMGNDDARCIESAEEVKFFLFF
jgi:hypothetical protein